MVAVQGIQKGEVLIRGGQVVFRRGSGIIKHQGGVDWFSQGVLGGVRGHEQQAVQMQCDGEKSNKLPH